MSDVDGERMLAKMRKDRGMASHDEAAGRYIWYASIWTNARTDVDDRYRFGLEEIMRENSGFIVEKSMNFSLLEEKLFVDSHRS